jgi:hypothetical protein
MLKYYLKIKRGEKMIINPTSTSVFTTTQTLKNDKEGLSGEPADGFQKSEEHAGYFENLGKSTLYGLKKGFDKGFGKGVDIGTDVIPDKYAPLNLFSAVFLGLPLGITFGCIAGPVGAVAGFAMGLVGKNIGKPEDTFMSSSKH